MFLDSNSGKITMINIKFFHKHLEGFNIAKRGPLEQNDGNY